MSTARLAATISRCRLGQPLVTLDSEPFNGLEVRPDELRRLAQQFTALAEMAERQPTSSKRYHHRPTKVEIGATPTAATTEGQPS